MLTLVLGGARSGKSRIAQSICESGSKVTCIATARLDDDEMRARISRHRRARPRSWITIEEPLAIADAVAAHSSSMDFILLDCLTLWLSNFCSERRDSSADSLEAAVQEEISRLAAASAASHIVAVSNEVGGGMHEITTTDPEGSIISIIFPKAPTSFKPKREVLRAT